MPDFKRQISTFSLRRLLAASALVAIGLICIQLNAGYSCALTLVFVLVFAAWQFSSESVVSARMIVYFSLAGMILTALAIQSFTFWLFGTFASPFNEPFFDPFFFPIEFSEWTPGDALRQCIFPLGGSIGCAMAILTMPGRPISNRQTPNK